MGFLDSVGRAAGSLAAGAISGWQESYAKANQGAAGAPGGTNPDNTTNSPVPTDGAIGPAKSLFTDPFAVLEQMGYKERASPMSYGTIQAIVQRMPVCGSVIHRRVNNVAEFAKLQKDRYDYGYRVALRDKREKGSRASGKMSDQFHTLIQRTGVRDNPRGHDNFEKFLRKVATDSLMYDQMTFEIVPNRAGLPAEFYAVDAASIRLADAQRLQVDESWDTDTRYVQIYDGVIINEYTQTELCFGIRNPKTDMRLHGYGTSELEKSLNAITGLLNGWRYNSLFFEQGSSAKGVLNFKGPIQESMMEKFKYQFYSMLTGVQNAWRTPIINADDVQWVPLQGMSNVDMEFSHWIDFLVKVFCSFYSMDPAEINFNYGNIGQTQQLNAPNNADKIVESRERGLRPLLIFIADCINTNIIWPINESFAFEFVGLESSTRSEVADLNGKRVKTYMTIDEVRAEDDQPPLPNGMGQLILDPTFLQAKSMAEQAPIQASQDPGDGDAPGIDRGQLKQLVSGNRFADEDDPENDDQEQQKQAVQKSLSAPYVIDVEF